MPAKPASELFHTLQTKLKELIAVLRKDHEVLGAEVGSMNAEFARSEVGRVRERLAVVESLIDELKKREEETDRRRWQLHLGFAVCVLTFVANLTVNLLMFHARK